MLWLFSLLFPGRYRQGDRPFDDFSRLIRTPESRFLILQIFGLLAGAVVLWLLIAGFLTLFAWWAVVLLAIGLGIAVMVQTHLTNRRQRWLDAGCCGNCGYDLRGTPDRCPECGRDSSLDEPTWRKLRREWGNIKPVEPEESQMVQPPPVPMPVIEIPSVPVVMKNPDLEEGPIPLEGEGEEMANDQVTKSQPGSGHQ